MNLKELILQEAFHQYFPMEADRFVEYCRERELNLNINYLEFLEREGILKPLMRVQEVYVNNTAYLKELYQHGFVIDPRQKEFIPWNEFYIKKERYRQEIVHTYYHPYQIYFISKILNNEIILTPLSFINENDKLILEARKWENFLKIRLDLFRNSMVKEDKFVELLLFIQNKYLPFVKQPGRIIFIENIYHSNTFEKLNELAKKIIPKDVINALGIDAEEIKSYRTAVVSTGLFIDPLKEWYDLIKYTNFNRRQKLKGKALLAQDFYLISEILALFLKDLTGEKQLETVSLFDSMGGRGKLRYYGKELNYVDRDILIRILHDYGLNPKPRLVLIVEGYSEETAFPIISEAMEVPLERFDIEIINLRGIDKDPKELIIYHSTSNVNKVDKEFYIHPERTKVFIIFDREGNKGSWVRDFINNPDKEIVGMMKDVLEMIKKKKVFINSTIEGIFFNNTVKHHIWEKSFEYDNFTDEELSKELNDYGEKHGYQFNITPDEMRESRIENRNLDKFIRNKTQNRTSINKKEFSEQLAKSIAKEIAERPNKSGNQRPIEQILDKIVRFTIENP